MEGQVRRFCCYVHRFSVAYNSRYEMSYNVSKEHKLCAERHEFEVVD
jgi:hypothetical protein